MSSKKITIGVMGSSNKSLEPGSNKRIEEIATSLGVAIAKRNLILITGATTGLPDKVVQAAKNIGAITVGISPASNLEEHIQDYQLPENGSDVTIFTGFGLNGRNVLNIRSSDILIFISGSMGTLNEFTIAYGEGKVIGVLQGSGGTADLIQEIVTKLPKKTKSVIIFESDVEKLLDACMLAYENRSIVSKL